MDDSRKKHLDTLDGTLAEVREQLQYTHEQGEVFELRALQLLLQVVKTMHGEHDIHALIGLILDSALSFMEADRAFLMMFDEQGKLRFKMGRSYAGAYLSEEEFVVSRGVVDEAIAGDQPIILTDAQKDAVFSKRQSIMDLELRTVMAAPLRYKTRVLGLLYVDSQRPMMRYSKHHLNVLTSLADQAAVALANARKFETHQG
ncbi:MAG: GAF domain-containing protein [Chloroflexi bacterium]|nr:GAF domain-containing protein [Chloroflexota bacterium]